MTNLPSSWTRGGRGFWPFDELDSWLTEAPKNLTAKGFAIDVLDQPDHYMVKADMPGINRENIDIVLENNTLTITQKAEDSKEEKEDGYLHRERWTQTSSRSVRLPKSSDEVTAALNDGVLEIKVAKAAEKLSRKIEIN